MTSFCNAYDARPQGRAFAFPLPGLTRLGLPAISWTGRTTGRRVPSRIRLCQTPPRRRQWVHFDRLSTSVKLSTSLSADDLCRVVEGVRRLAR